MTECLELDKLLMGVDRSVSIFGELAMIRT
jgi:hypothetical protein